MITEDEFQFLVMNKKQDWDKGLSVSLSVSNEGIKLLETFDYKIEQNVFAKDLGQGLVIKDFTICKGGHVFYILDTNTSFIYLYDLIQNRTYSIECIGSMFSNPSAITCGQGTLYVSDIEAEHRVFNFAEGNWQIRWTIGNVHDAAGIEIDLEQVIKPIDLAVDQKGNLYVLDQNNSAIIQFNNDGRFVAAFGEDELRGKKPIAITLSQNGDLYVLETQEKRVLKLVSGKLKPYFKIDLPIEPSGLAIDSSGHFYIGDNRKINPYAEDDRFIFRFNSKGKMMNEISGYRGSVKKMAADEKNRLYVFNEDEQKIIILKRQQTYMKLGKTSQSKGTYFSKTFDSRKEGMVWHKLVLDAIIPENTRLKVSYLISEDKKFSIQGIEGSYDDFLADSVMSSKQKIDILNQLRWSESIINPKDTLIRGDAGRYLCLRIELVGSEWVTPEIKSIRAVFPRMSYLRYLPAVYQEDEDSRDFLERYLSLFETFFSNVETEIDHIARFFDPDAVSGDFLRWLSSWLDIVEDENWPEEKLRLLVKKVPELYKMRGTRRGIEEMISIYTGEKPIILEQFQLQGAGIKETDDLYSKDPYTFYVLFAPYQIKNEQQLDTVRRILDLEKPAYTRAVLSVLEPWINLSKHTYLGINTYLSKPELRLDSGAVMERDTVLTDRDAGRIESPLGLDIDSFLT